MREHGLYAGCDVAVIDGGLGGVAAALAAAETGATVLLSEATDWIGGQMTNQSVSARQASDLAIQRERWRNVCRRSERIVRSATVPNQPTDVGSGDPTRAVEMECCSNGTG